MFLNLLPRLVADAFGYRCCLEVQSSPTNAISAQAVVQPAQDAAHHPLRGFARRLTRGPRARVYDRGEVNHGSVAGRERRVSWSAHAGLPVERQLEDPGRPVGLL